MIFRFCSVVVLLLFPREITTPRDKKRLTEQTGRLKGKTNLTEHGQTKR